jgi:hypothetical protein
MSSLCFLGPKLPFLTYSLGNRRNSSQIISLAFFTISVYFMWLLCPEETVLIVIILICKVLRIFEEQVSEVS